MQSHVLSPVSRKTGGFGTYQACQHVAPQLERHSIPSRIIRSYLGPQRTVRDPTHAIEAQLCALQVVRYRSARLAFGACLPVKIAQLVTSKLAWKYARNNGSIQSSNQGSHSQQTCNMP